MNTRILFSLCLLVCLSCSDSPKLHYASALEGCLPIENLVVVDNATKSFEDALRRRYSSTDTNQSYLQYLKDVQTMNVPIDFFLSEQSSAIRETLKDSKTFGKIWIYKSNLKVQSSSDSTESTKVGRIDEGRSSTDNSFDPLLIDKSGEYFECLQNSTISSALKKALDTQAKNPGLSPSLYSKSLLEELTASDFENPLNKTAIAISFYYELGFQLEATK